MKKQELLDILQQMPDPFDAEQLIGDLYLKAKLERAETAVREGRTIGHEDVVRQTREWFQ